jgi:hypothetical protein
MKPTNKPREERTMTTSTHTPAPWYVDADGFVCDQQDKKVCDPHADDRDIDEREANAALIAAAPRLLNALEMSEQAIEEVTDIMHYEDGLPVTALEGWEIERAYGALCSLLVEVHQAIAAAKGEQP